MIGGTMPGRIIPSSGAAGIERLEAHFQGAAFAPHRHDTYAIGMTLSDVQTFRFRGEQWHCLPGQIHILHPDETHDGQAGTEAGFAYRMVYVDPFLIRQVLHGKPLPFVRQPVVDVGHSPDLWRNDRAIDDLTRVELIVDLSHLLECSAMNVPHVPGVLALDRLTRIREALVACPHSMDELERLSGLDRWTIARQFRLAFGTSPSRFRTMRQLDRVRRLLRRGTPLAEAAIDAGFADQSHMSRHFKKAYGLTPARWVASLA